MTKTRLISIKVRVVDHYDSGGKAVYKIEYYPCKINNAIPHSHRRFK